MQKTQDDDCDYSCYGNTGVHNGDEGNQGIDDRFGCFFFF